MSTGIAPVFHPLGAPVVNGDTITVDTLLRQPTRVTNFIMDLTQARFLLDRLFTSAGGVTGGAVIYDVVTENEMFLERDVERIAPAGEFPLVTGARRAPKVAEVEKWGGKFYTTYEARDRNDLATFRNNTIQLSNTIVRKLNTRAVEILEAAIAANGGLSEFVGVDWGAAVPTGSNPSLPAAQPSADFAKAQMLADQRELGIRFDLALVNTVNLMELRNFYRALGGGLEDMLDDLGFDEIFASNRIPVGTAYFVARGQLGEMRVEQPLQTITYDEPKTEREWTQSSVRPVMFVNNPFAVMKVTGI